MTNPTARAIFAAGLPTEADLLALLPSDLGGLTVLGHLQRMAEDAARYRWLRECDDSDPLFVMYGSNGAWGECGHSCISDELLDKSIDAERAKALTHPANSG